MKFFMIAASSPTPEQRNAITFIFRDKPEFGFWHWTPDFWLINTITDSYTSASIRDAVRDTVPGLFFAVFAVNPVPDDWAMWSDKTWAEWVQKNWPSIPKL